VKKGILLVTLILVLVILASLADISYIQAGTSKGGRRTTSRIATSRILSTSTAKLTTVTITVTETITKTVTTTVTETTTTTLTNQCQLTIGVFPAAGGSTTPLPGYYSYDSGSSVTVSEAPATGYAFDYWDLDGSNVGSNPNCTVVMEATHTLTAIFKVVSPLISGWLHVSWKGVSIHNQWQYWDQATMESEIADMANHGFNFVFIDLVTMEHWIGQTEGNIIWDNWRVAKLDAIMEAIEANGLKAAMGQEFWGPGWYRTNIEFNYWWTQPERIQAEDVFWYNVGYFLKQKAYPALAFFDICPEPEWYFGGWVDGKLCAKNNLPALAAADIDWQNYLSSQGITRVPLNLTNIEVYKTQYIAWSRKTFHDMIVRRIDSFNQGSGGTVEPWSTSGEYYKASWSAETDPSGYINPDVLGDIPTLKGFRYDNFFRENPYKLDALKRYIAEVQKWNKPWITGQYAMGSLPTNIVPPSDPYWWQVLEPCLDSIWSAAPLCRGNTYFSWQDFDSDLHFGLKDSNFNPREPGMTQITMWNQNHS